MNYYSAYSIEGLFSTTVKAKSLDEAWKKMGKKMKKEKVSLKIQKSDNDEQTGIVFSEISKEFYKSLKNKE